MATRVPATTSHLQTWPEGSATRTSFNIDFTPRIQEHRTVARPGNRAAERRSSPAEQRGSRTAVGRVVRRASTARRVGEQAACSARAVRRPCRWNLLRRHSGRRSSLSPSASTAPRRGRGERGDVIERPCNACAVASVAPPDREGGRDREPTCTKPRSSDSFHRPAASPLSTRRDRAATSRTHRFRPARSSRSSFRPSARFATTSSRDLRKERHIVCVRLASSRRSKWRFR